MTRTSPNQSVITRRKFLKGALSASALYGIGGGLLKPALAHPGPGPFDVAIVGAGLAGLTAANILAAAGKRIVVLEARPRVGGRTVCDNTFPVPVDLGAQWFHQGLANPLVPLAQARGFTTIPDAFPRRLYNGSTPLPFDDPDVVAAVAMFGLMNSQINQAGSLIAEGQQADQSLAATEADIGLDPSVPWYKFATNLIASPRGATMVQNSTLDVANLNALTIFPLGTGTGEELFVLQGMGNFVAGFSAHIPIKLNTPASKIINRKKRVDLLTPSGTVRAHTAIVTAPIGVLAADPPVIGFQPLLPDAYTAAIASLPMGLIDKIWLEYETDVFPDGLPGINTFGVQLRDEEGLGFVTAKFWGKNVVLVLVGAHIAAQLESEGPTAMVNFAISTVQELFPDATADTIKNTSLNPWGLDQWSLGSYPYCVPGGVPAHDTLAVPVDNRLFFAGDATSLYAHGSLAGAYQSAQVASQLALLVLNDPTGRREIALDDVKAVRAKLGILPPA